MYGVELSLFQRDRRIAIVLAEWACSIQARVADVEFRLTATNRLGAIVARSDFVSVVDMKVGNMNDLDRFLMAWGGTSSIDRLRLGKGYSIVDDSGLITETIERVAEDLRSP